MKLSEGLDQKKRCSYVPTYRRKCTVYISSPSVVADFFHPLNVYLNMYASFAKPNASKCYYILYILNSRRALILVVRIVFIVGEESGQIDLGILIDQERNHSSRDNS
jgi:hypothetical protein